MNTILKNKLFLSWSIFALVTIIVLYYLGSRAGKAKNNNLLDKEIKSNSLTFQLNQFVIFADSLFTAMQGFTDDEETIFATFRRMRSTSDVLQLIKSFGSRRLPFTIGSATLPEWLNYRLSKTEIQQINDILTRNNIDFNF